MKAIQIRNDFTDQFIDRVARVSFDSTEAARSPEQIAKLNRFLIFNDHWSPLAHPMTTVVCRELPTHELVQHKTLLAGLNIHYEMPYYYITAGAWGLLKLAQFLQSKQLFEMVLLRAPETGIHFQQHFALHLNNNGDFSWAEQTPRQHQWATFQIEAPIPIRTQDFKHKVGFIDNEVSRRYVSYMPKVHHVAEWRGRPENAKQGSSGSVTIPSHLRLFSRFSDWVALKTYEKLIAAGVAAEQARFKLPQGVNTKYIRTGTREAFENYFTLRCAPDAQKEIQELATMIRDTIQYQSA